MRLITLTRTLSTFFLLTVSSLLATDVTVSSFNCGALPDHYDYIRAVCMQKLAQERHNLEPEEMAQLEKIQNCALKILFSRDPEVQNAAQQEWDRGQYTEAYAKLTAHPNAPGSINRFWRNKSEATLTSYQKRPVLVLDQELRDILQEHLYDLCGGRDTALNPESPLDVFLTNGRQIMAERIFRHRLKYDIIALQEADYLDKSMLPSYYEVQFAQAKHSVNGVAWRKDRFELLGIVGEIAGRGFVVKLRELESGQTVAVASGHLSGCNPFRIETDEQTGNSDSAKGDKELLQIIDLLEKSNADIKVIAMDSNVTASHPRMALLKEADYTLDSSKYLDPSCTSPWQVLNTRIDWIAVKLQDPPISIHNIPVLGVGLNSPQTNISDHKPIAARLSF